MSTPERPDLMDVPSASGNGAGGAFPEQAAAQAKPEGANVARRMDIVNLTAGFGERTVIADINLAVEPNAVTALIGPSGCRRSAGRASTCGGPDWTP